MNCHLVVPIALLFFTAVAHAQPPAAVPPPPPLPEIKIEPTFEEIPEMTFAGIAAYAGPGSGRFPELWTAGFHAVMKGAEDNAGNELDLATGRYCYGLELFSPEFENDPKRNFTYMACYAVSDSRNVPLHLLQRTIPGARFAVFKVPDGLKGLGGTFGFIYGKWLPQSGFDRAYAFDMERYDIEATRKNNGNLQIEILVPIVPHKG